MTKVLPFHAPGPWLTRDLKECVLASDYDRLRRELDEARGLLREARGPVDHAARYAFGHLHTEVAEDLFALVNRIDKAIASDQPDAAA